LLVLFLMDKRPFRSFGFCVPLGLDGDALITSFATKTRFYTMAEVTESGEARGGFGRGRG
jgi:hypothetical protein